MTVNIPAPLRIALTVTYRKHYSNNPMQQFKDTLPPLARNLARCAKRFQLAPELTLDGNIHYHGLIDIDNEYRWFRYIQPWLKRQGFYKAKVPKNLHGWLKYMTKAGSKYAIKMFDLQDTYINESNIKDYLKKFRKTKHQIKIDFDDGITRFFKKPPAL